MAGKAKVWTLERIKSFCVIEGDCWIWQRNFTKEGYPTACFSSRVRSVKLVAKELENGRRAKTRVAVSDCDEKRCVNPDHHRLVTRPQAVERQKKDGRVSRGPSHGAATRRGRGCAHYKLDHKSARQIRLNLAQGASVRSQAALYGVSVSHIHRIRLFQCWA